MTKNITKEAFITEVRQTYADWQSYLDRIPLQEMDIPIDKVGWSVKDIIAHITWHEREMIGVLNNRALVGSELWELPLDERNAAIYEKFKDLPLEEILRDAKQTHAELMPLLGTLTTEELNNADFFDEMPKEWAPWDVIASNTSRHYRDHTKDLMQWIANRKAS